MRTKIKVKIRVKRFSKKQFILHLLLQPCIRDFDDIVHDVRLQFNIGLDEAERRVQRWCNYVDEWGLSYKERDMFFLPNIGGRFPKLAYYWKSPVADVDD